MTKEWKEQEKDLIFALDIGTRSIIGVLGKVEDERFHVLAIEKEEHGKRAMIDGQIEDIAQVAKVACIVTSRLEERMNTHLTRVCVAAAGRALRMERAHFELELPSVQRISTELISQLEAGAVSEAEESLRRDSDEERRFFLVGYTVAQYQLDHYPLTTLKDHNGKKLEADVVATFLPSEVVESLYSAMRAANLEVVSLTLEPIAALNAAIPEDLRLLNLVMADIGAGTSDIAVCRDGSVVGYTMATVAGDEITETIMKQFLVDFKTAERMKLSISATETISYTDVLGLVQEVTSEELQEAVVESSQMLAKKIADCILNVNEGPPSALFLAGGGSKLVGLQGIMAESLGMDQRRVALAGNNFQKSAFSEDYELDNPEYATPLGIAISAGLGLISDSYIVTLNGQAAKLFRSGTLTVQDILLMNGYTYSDMIGRTGNSLSVTLNGKREIFRGEPATPSILRLNGEDAAISAVVHAGDSIEFIPASHGKSAVRTVEELLGTDFSGLAIVNGAEVSLKSVLCSGDVIVTEENEKRQQNRITVMKLEGSEPLKEQEIKPSSEERDLEKPDVLLKPISVILNNEKLNLPGKEDGTPYYLMDLLRFSGIDFERLERPVILQVNGEDAFFRQEIKDHDTILIQCEN